MVKPLLPVLAWFSVDDFRSPLPPFWPLLPFQPFFPFMNVFSAMLQDCLLEKALLPFLVIHISYLQHRLSQFALPPQHKGQSFMAGTTLFVSPLLLPFLLCP